MAVHDYVISNGTGAAVRSDLNGALAAIVSNNSSATEPATMYAYQWWADTTTGLLKQRNAANSAWVTIGTMASANLGLLSLAGGTMTGVLAVTAGTAALPGIAVSGDLNTGLVSPGADQLAITTGGTSRLAVSTTAVSSTLAVDVPLGAVGTPSITFTGDLNTGLFSPGADTVALVTGGTNRVHVTSAGLVGIGTTAPNRKLEVSDASTDNFIRVNTTGATKSGIEFASGGTVYSQLYFNNVSPYDLSLLQQYTTGSLILGTNSTERARIDSSGRLLVGTTTNSGANLLQVNSDALVNGLTVGRGASAIGSNTAVGYQALFSNTTGSYNTANGVYALFSNTTGSYNTANGLYALFSNTTGSYNTANGVYALLSNTTGSQNTANGLNAGYGVGTNPNTTGSNNTFIGNESVGASSTASNVITLGNGSITTLRCQVTTITALSDERDKKNIVPLNAGLDFLTRLRPVSFTWNTRDKAKVDVEDTGFIAQELLAVQEDTGITIPNLVSQENPDKLEAGYGTLIPVLVSAVQELTAMVKQLQDEIITLKGDN